MAKLVPGRHTAEIDGDFVVFIIGARINKKRHLIGALRALGNLPKMCKYLMAHREKGLLHYEMAGFTSIQYWRSFDHLERFAHDPDPHLDQWRRYTQLSHASADAGIWHETYLVPAGQFEAIYDNVPPRGLAKAGRLVSVRDSSRARGRVGAASG
jgi:hypothetical protein